MIAVVLTFVWLLKTIKFLKYVNCSPGQTVPTFQDRSNYTRYRNIVGCSMLQHILTCWVLLAQIQPFSNLSQQYPKYCNIVAKHAQHVACNNVAAISYIEMLESFSWGLKL